MSLKANSWGFSVGNVNRCSDAVGFILEKFDRYWGLGQALIMAISDLQTEAASADLPTAADAVSLVGKLDPGHVFQQHWQTIIAASNQDGTFPWDYQLVHERSMTLKP
jgi:hypothetical protein